MSLEAGPGEFNVDDARWDGDDYLRLCNRAIEATVTHLGLDANRVAVSILLTNDARIAGLNAEYRDRDAATNVLSWPADELGAEKDGEMPAEPEPDPDGAIELGDIALSWETCAAEADAQGKRLDDHLTHLVVHGTLHLLGYDHVRDQDAALMEGTEVDILEKLGIQDPYSVGNYDEE